ncbi:hypothetical protein Tco_0381620 [Tanacetum coccineum]
MQLNKEIFQKNNTYVNQNEPSFDQLFELNNLKAELQAKDTTIEKLKANIKRLNKTSTTNNVKKDIDEIETINIELEHRVTKLIAENEHLKQTYKQLYDSIKPSRVRAKEQTDICMNVRAKSVSKKNKKRKEWKPTGKVFNSIGYKWKPTKRTFTLVGNACPLTRLTTTKKVPLRGSHSSRKWNSVHLGDPIFQLLHLLLLLTELRLSKIVLYLESGYCKHMTGDRSQLTNFVHKFLGTIKFGNNQVVKIMGYGDYQIGNVTISRVYYVEGLGHNLFSVGQFCDSDLEVAFRKHTCFVHNLEGVDLLLGSRGTNLYSLSIGDMMASSPICLLSKATKTKS